MKSYHKEKILKHIGKKKRHFTKNGKKKPKATLIIFLSYERNKTVTSDNFEVSKNHRNFERKNKAFFRKTLLVHFLTSKSVFKKI